MNCLKKSFCSLKFSRKINILNFEYNDHLGDLQTVIDMCININRKRVVDEIWEPKHIPDTAMNIFKMFTMTCM